MRIAGFVKNSFVDYPGHIAAVVFVPGCNLDCWYCHNRHIWKDTPLIHPAEVDAYLQKRRGFIDSVVITGGEPTLQKDLPAFIERIRSLGYKVKLDTNGLKPEFVEPILPLIDYVAMDLKAPPGGYFPRVVSFPVDEQAIWHTADLLMNAAPCYEFRTTFMPTLTQDDVAAIARRVRGAQKYVLQQYRKPERTSHEALGSEAIKKAAQAASQFINNVSIRGI